MLTCAYCGLAPTPLHRVNMGGGWYRYMCTPCRNTRHPTAPSRSWCRQFVKSLVAGIKRIGRKPPC